MIFIIIIRESQFNKSLNPNNKPGRATPYPPKKVGALFLLRGAQPFFSVGGHKQWRLSP